MRVFVIALALTTFVSVLAQTPAQSKDQQKAPADAIKAPVIPLDDIIEFYKTQSAQLQAQTLLNSANSDLQASINKLVKDCGEDFTPSTLTPKSNPVCLSKPKLNIPADQKKDK